MRVVIVNQHPSVALGGSETQCRLIAEGLAGLGHEVVWIAPGGATMTPTTHTVLGVEDRALAITAAVVEAAPDVVYWRFGTRHLGVAVRRLHRAGLPIVFASSHVKDLRRWSTPLSARTNPVLRMAELVRGRLRSAWDHRGLLEVDALVVNNTTHLGLVPVARQAHIANGSQTATRAFRWKRPYVAWIANLKPAKRPEACVALARAIADLDVDVIMAGRIVTESYRWFEDPSLLPPNLHYVGPVDPVDANGILAGARCHVHTCLPEGFSNVFIQAWTAGVPSISLGFDPEDTITRERIGAVCGDDPERLATEVRAFLLDDARREAAGARARAHALARFDTVRNVAALEALLVEVTAARPRPSASAVAMPGAADCAHDAARSLDGSGADGGPRGAAQPEAGTPSEGASA